MLAPNEREFLLEFMKEYSLWYNKEMSRSKWCDPKLYVNYACCLVHKCRAIEFKAFSEKGTLIDREFPSIRNGNTFPMILSPDWFIKLALVSGVQLPDDFNV